MGEAAPPGATTPAFLRFLDIQNRDFDFLKLVNVLAGSVPQVLEVAKDANPELYFQLHAMWEQNSFRDNVPSLMRTWCEIMLTRSVDNFHSYLTDVLAVVFGHHPSHLKTNIPVTMREVIEQVSMPQFINWAIRRRSKASIHSERPRSTSKKNSGFDWQSLRTLRGQ